ncbi:MAG: hypothetical protein ACI87E_003735 [Mariniblastus sp.]
MIFDFRNCELGELDIALCQYAVELTLWPGEMSQSNVDRLREVGLSDQQITIATQVVSYFNYINRIADGLGVDWESWMTISIEQWLAEKPIWREVL